MSEVTLKQLADMLQLSISTVSRALKNHPDISKETRLKVKELAVMLDYEPNTYAINLRSSHTREFGIIIPAISNDFYQSFIRSLEEEARQFGYSLIILQSGDDPLIELENLRRCKQTRVAGVFVSITSQTTDISQFLKLAEHQVPVIFFDKVPAFEACNKVCVDDSAAATIAAEALLLRGKKSILSIFGSIKLSITQKRLKAYNDAFVKYNSGIQSFSYHANSMQEAYAVMLNSLKTGDRPDAVFCMNDEILTGVMKAIQEMQLRPPHDVGVIAISDGLTPTFYHPEITYVETSGYKLAKMTFSRMLACLADNSYIEELRIESFLVEGGSL